MKNNKLLVVACTNEAEFFSLNKKHIKFLKRLSSDEDITINDSRRKSFSGFHGKSSTNPSHYYDPHQSHKDIVGEHFSKKVSDELHTMVKKDHIDKILIAADSTTLGKLRKAMHPDISGKIVNEIHKYLADLPTKDLEKYLKKTDIIF